MYKLVPSYSSVPLRRVDGALVPAVSNLTVRVTKQTGDDTPVTIAPANWDAHALSVEYVFHYNTGVGLTQFYTSSGINVNVEASGVTIKLYRETVEVDSVTVPFVADGADGVPGTPGERGPVLRGPQAWAELPVGYQFESGAAGESFLDLVLYHGNYYMCKASHAKTAGTAPGSTAGSAVWFQSVKFDLIATSLLLAEYALIHNLGVESVEMKDADGNVLCTIKDGVIKINTGEFQNVKVSGDITADSLSFKLADGAPLKPPSGSLLYHVSGVTLPELEPGTTRLFRVVNPNFYPDIPSMTPGDLAVTALSGSIMYPSATSKYGSSSVTIQGGGENSGRAYEFLGVNSENHGSTRWYIHEYSLL